MTTVRNPIEGLFTRTFDKPSDFLCCAFGLRSSEIDTYFALLSEPKSVKDIAKDINKDRSTVQRVLSRLLEKGLVVMETKYFDRGGFYHEYQAVSTEDVKQDILDQLDEWYSKTKRFLLKSWSAPSQR